MLRTVLIFFVLLSTACQRPPMVMPTMFKSGQVAPFAETDAASRSNRHTLFYATDRQFDPRKPTTGFYNHLRNDALSLGTLEIDLGRANAWRAFDAATRNQPDGRRPRPELTLVHRVAQMRRESEDQQPFAGETPGERAYVDLLNDVVERSTHRAITIYIHGFRNSFEEAALTAAELSLYTDGLGAMVLYSWPSLDSLFEYSHDRDSVRFTTAHARRFIEMLANAIEQGRLCAEQINFIAHSSGAEVVGSVLRELGLKSHQRSAEERQRKWRIGKVLFVAPDISTDVARERILKEDLRGMYEQMVVYGSKRDTALRWASRVLYRTQRFGSINERRLSETDRRWLSQADRITLVDIDSQPTNDPIRHSHHRYSGAALSDLLLSLRSDLTPAQRGLVREEGKIVWRFADDYEQRVTEAALRVYRQSPALND